MTETPWEVALSLVIDEHRTYLSDRVRLGAYAAAIEDAVRPNDIVLDLGCGTGILGLLACRAGAARVYAVDATGMIEIARRLGKDNGFSDRIVYLKQLSRDADLPERVDVIVCDQMGPFGFEGGVVEYFADARQRFLKPGGRLIPKRISLLVAPVEAPDLLGKVDFWTSKPAGFQFDSVRRWAVNTGSSAKYDPAQFLGDEVVGHTIDLDAATAARFEFDACLIAKRHGTLHGIAGWFSAALTEKIGMSNSPLAADAIDRESVFFPLDRAVSIEEGDRITVRMHIMPVDAMVTWDVSIATAAGGGADTLPLATFQHSTFKGMLLSREQLQRTRPWFKPTLTRRGRARASVLALCDGDRPLVDIEDRMFAQYPDLFGTRNQAAVFVSEVLANDAG